MSDYDKIRTALNYIDPHDRDTWIRVGGAIKDEMGDEGFELWDSWSQQAENYNAKNAQYMWNRSIKAGRVRINSLFYEAIKGGYDPKQFQSEKPSPEEQAKRAAAAKERAAQDAKKVAEDQARAKDLAKFIWSKGEPVNPNHPYLLAKGITDAQTLSSIRQNHYQGEDNLLIPVIQDKEIVSMQFIDKDGGKKFIAGGQVGGSYHLVGDAKQFERGIVLAEGYATAASINQATGLPVMVAFNAGNLVSVSEKLAQNLPNHIPVTIAADNDASLTGITKAKQAAEHFGDRAKIVMPEFSQALIEKYQAQHGQDKLPSDFNDLHQLTSLDNVQRIIEPDNPRSERAPWRDFPPVVRNADLKDLSKEPEYQAAKAGDEHQAIELVNKLIKPETIEQLKELIGDKKPVLVPIMSEEANGNNKIPLAAASLLGHELGLEVGHDVVQINHVGRTGAGIDHRLAFPPVFDGQIEAGQDYLLIDDTLSVGGTIAAARGYIENRGGNVMGAAVMTAHKDVLNIVVKSNMLAGMEAKHGDTMDSYWKKEFGYGTDKLTQGEAGHVKAAENVEQIRNRITAARDAASIGVHESVLSQSPPEVDKLDNPIMIPKEATDTVAFSMSEEDMANMQFSDANDDYFDPSMADEAFEYFNQSPPPEPMSEPIFEHEALDGLLDADEIKAELNSIEFMNSRTPEHETHQQTSFGQEAKQTKQATDEPDMGNASQDAKPEPVIDLKYKAPPLGLEHKYLVNGGQYFDKNGRTVLFEDKGKSISTGRQDQQTMQDMLKVAQAKGWESIKLKGTPEFKQQMFVLAEAQGIKTTGYTPNEHDLKMVEQQRELMSLNKIEQGESRESQTPDTNKTPDSEKETPQKLEVDVVAISQADKLISQNEKPTTGQINTSELMDTHLGQSADAIGVKSVVPEIANIAQDMKQQARGIDLATSKSMYMGKANKLSKANRGKLAFYERQALKTIDGLEGEHKNEALRNYYEHMTDKMSGSKLNMPDPMQIPNQQDKPSWEQDKLDGKSPQQDHDHEHER